MKKRGVLTERERDKLASHNLGKEAADQHRCSTGCRNSVCILDTERIVLLAAAREGRKENSERVAGPDYHNGWVECLDEWLRARAAELKERK